MNDEDIEITIEHEVQHDIAPPAPVIYQDCGACGKIIKKNPVQCLFCEEWLHVHGCGYLASKKSDEERDLIIGGLCCPMCYREHFSEFNDTCLEDIKRLYK